MAVKTKPRIRTDLHGFDSTANGSSLRVLCASVFQSTVPPVEPRTSDIRTVNQELDYKQRVDRNDLRQLYKDLSHSKLALCYESVFPGMRPFPHSFLTMRWFEAGASGCVIVGKRPSTPLVDDLLDWENSTIELPSDGEEAVEKIKELLKRPDRLGEISKRNYQQKLRRHDWRWRIKQMLELLKTPVPTKLNAQLQEIEAYGDD